MKEQNYKNHSRLVPGFHGFTFFAILALLVGSIINIFTTPLENIYSASLICLAAVIFALLFYYLRTFVLVVQDRAIRAEESLRYFILTGKPLPSTIRMNQVIALRFASDEELAELVERTVTENLRNKEIKQAVKNWRGDHHRA